MKNRQKKIKTRQKSTIKRLGIVCICFLSSMSFSCVEAPQFTDTPQLEFIGFEKDTVQQESMTTFRFKFTDGDGDIGSDQTPNVFLKDLRQPNALPEPFVMPMLPEEGSGNGVEGVATIHYQATRCIYANGTTGLSNWQEGFKRIDTVVFELYIVDRAGHESNHVKTDTLFLSCPP